MGIYVLKRLLSAVPVLFGLTVIVFLIMVTYIPWLSLGLLGR